MPATQGRRRTATPVVLFTSPEALSTQPERLLPVGRCLRRRPRAVGLLLVLLAAAPAGADRPALDAPVEVRAERIEYVESGTVYVASGGVVVQQAGRVLTADWAAISLETRQGVASGRVRITEADQSVEAAFAVFDVDSMRGVLFDADVDTGAGGFVIAGRELRRESERDYAMRDGGFTSCRCPDEDDREPWRIETAEADIELGGYGEARGSTVDVLGVPVAWLPWILFPVKTERETGFLLPDLAFGGRNGVQVGLPFFWAARHDVGVVAVPRWLEERGYQAELEVEYLVGERSGGLVSGSYVRDRTAVPGVTRQDANRWAARVEHDQHLPRGFRARVDAKAVSDNAYLDDFDEVARYRRDLFLRSRAFAFGALGSAGRLGMGTGLRWADDIQSPLGPGRDRTLLHRMPEASLRALPGRGPGLDAFGLVAGLDTDFVYFYQRESPLSVDPAAPIGPNGTFLDAGIAPSLGAADPTRADGFFEPGEPLLEHGSRLVVHPRIARPVSFGRLARLTPEVGYAQWLYDGTLRGVEERGLWNARADLRTHLVASRDLGGDRIGEHRLEPFVRYTFVRTRDQAEVPVFVPPSVVVQDRLRQLAAESYVRDPADRIPDANLLAVGLENGFRIARRQGGIDPLRADLWVSFQHDFDRSSAGRLVVGGRGTWRGRVDGEAHISWDVGAGTIDEGLVGVRVGLGDPGPVRGAYVSTRYRYLRTPPPVAALTEPRVDQIDVGAGFRLAERLLLRYSLAWSVDDGSRLAQNGTLIYASRCRCFSIGFDVVEDRTRDVFFRVRYSITGFGDRARDPFAATRRLFSNTGF